MVFSLSEKVGAIVQMSDGIAHAPIWYTQAPSPEEIVARVAILLELHKKGILLEAERGGLHDRDRRLSVVTADRL